MKYIIGERYWDRILLWRTNSKWYLMKCIYCWMEWVHNISQSLKTLCICQRDDTKFKLWDIVNWRRIVGRCRPNYIVTECTECWLTENVLSTDLDRTFCDCKPMKDNYWVIEYDSQIKVCWV